MLGFTVAVRFSTLAPATSTLRSSTTGREATPLAVCTRTCSVPGPTASPSWSA